MMTKSTTVAQLAANRKNAKKSTGPKTLAGKKASALNATKHALRSVSPVLPGVEQVEAWEAHRDATTASLAPSGYLEEALAERVASLLWRLGRVTRFETENVASRLEVAETDMARSLRYASDRFVGTPRQLEEELDLQRQKAAAFTALRDAHPDKPFYPPNAETVAREVAARAQVELEDVELPFLSPEVDELGWDQWTGWTKKLVLALVARIVAASKLPAVRDSDPEEIWHPLGRQAEADVYAATYALQNSKEQLQRSVRSRLLLTESDLEKVSRYETHLERALYRALHELQRIQALRAGDARAVPMALAVDLSVSKCEKEDTIDTPGEDTP
jgi:hypothetical protein